MKTIISEADIMKRTVWATTLIIIAAILIAAVPHDRDHFQLYQPATPAGYSYLLVPAESAPAYEHQVHKNAVIFGCQSLIVNLIYPPII